jgi:hypothetical protein
MGAKILAFDIFQTPLSSHYPLPLRYNKILFIEYTRNQRQENLAKLHVKCTKPFLAMKSAKLPELSRAAVGLGLLYLFDYLYLP